MCRRTERTVRRYAFDASCIFLYLAAIVSANLVVAAYGQIALPFTAFLLIPFDLVTRDVLHERWHGDALWPKMLALIASGSVLAYLLNADAARVAVASFLAFAAANLTNAIVFELTVTKLARWWRMNVSNLFAALADSIVFPIVAFTVSGVDWGLSAAQWGSKFVGGLVFSSIYVLVARKGWLPVDPKGLPKDDTATAPADPT